MWYYTIATKIFSIILAVYTAFTGVLMPRMSALYSEGKMDEFKRLIDKSVHLLFSFAIPAVFFTVIYSPEIIRFISGEGYEGAYLPARIIMPLIFIIGYEQILVIQILMPTKQDKVVLRNSMIGAFVGCIANFLLVNNYQSVGSSIVWVMSELVVLFSALIGIQKIIKMTFPMKALIKYLLIYMPVVVILYFIREYFELSTFLLLFIGGIVMIIYMLGIQVFVEKNNLILNLLFKYSKK